MDEKRWYVYLLCDPDTEEPFYVGKGTGDRMYHHEHLWQHDGNNLKKQTIQAIHSTGKEVLKKKVAEFDVEQDAYIYEWATANVYHSQITNIHPCGYGSRSEPRGTFPVKKPIAQLDDTRLWTKQETADYLRVSVRRVVGLPGLPYFKLGIVRFRPEAVKEWAAANSISAVN